ncbi:MAG: nucleotidyltransferase family protein [Eubacteriales bacterium]
MAVIGIICEYNPLHRGHAYQLAEIRRRYPTSTVLCVMSGSFTQRGTPAVLSKFARARAAVSLGADIVTELPVPYAIAGAEWFARGGVRLLRALGADTLCFGTEGDAAPALISAAQRLDSPAFRAALSAAQADAANASRGYPVLVEQVYTQLYGAEDASLLRTPNNILGISYIRAANADGMQMRFEGIPRIGAAHDAPLAETADRMTETVSASAVRACLHRGLDARAMELLPAESAEILRQETEAGRLVRRPEPILGALMLQRYRTAQQAELARYAGLSGGTAGRLCRAAAACADLSGFYAQAASKSMTHAAIRRAALCGLLGITDAMQHAAPVYTQLLAAAETDAASALLRGYAARYRKADTELPAVITRPASYKRCNAAVREAFEKTLCADAVWGMLAETPIPQAQWLRMGAEIRNTKSNDAIVP